ncbi:MAG TPA: hypothetical protein V6C57_25525 [Coleofasciculaceae cyanobacterium]
MKNRITVSYSIQVSPTHPVDQNRQVKQASAFSVFCKIWKNGLVKLRRSTEPRLWQTSDCWGNTWWHAYHPATGDSAIRESAAEIVGWIERAERMRH